MNVPQIKVGDEYFIYDINKRVYESKNSAPTFRGHFQAVSIVSETSRSWIVENRGIKFKVAKAAPWAILYTPAMIDEAEWVNDNRYKIENKIRTASAEQLRAIADILEHHP